MGRKRAAHVPLASELVTSVMPSASLQSRIRAFEALSSPPPATMSTPALLLSAPTADNRTSSLLESPISPTASTFHPIAPFVAPASSSRSRSPSPSTPSLASQTSLIDLKDWIVEDGPVEPPSAFRHPLTPGTRKLNGIPESSRTPSPSRRPTSAYGTSNSLTPLINFDSPQNSRPPLPPRKPSNSADRVSTPRSISAGSEMGAKLHPPGRSDSQTVEHTYPPGPHNFGAGRVAHVSASSISSFHSVSLSSDGSNVEIHSPKMSSKLPPFISEADSSATDIDTASIAESFENVSTPSAASPSTATHFDWEQGFVKSRTSKLEPPGLPNRPSTKPIVPPKPLARSVSVSSSSTATSTRTRRPPPPPPPYQPRSRPSSSRTSVVSTSASTSDRSSILSNATTTSRTSISTRNSAQFGSTVASSPLLRPTPVPPAARSRYESLFDSAVQGQRKAAKRAEKTKLLSPPPLSTKKGRQAAGWRGLSVDLINPEDHPVLSSEHGREESDGDEEEGSSSVTPEEKLNGRIVKYIWNVSRLDRQKLRSIW